MASTLVTGLAAAEKTTTSATRSTTALEEGSGSLGEEHDSVSCGSTNRGALSDAAVMPVDGPGYVMAEPWRSRETRYGTHELVSLVQRSSEAVAQEHEGSRLSVADLSLETGGPIAMHRSHQNGRDVDLIYYAMDASGAPFDPDSYMANYTRDGSANYSKSANTKIPQRYFDLKRNWSLVRAMISDPGAEVEHIFVSPRVERWLLTYAAKAGDDELIIKKAARILHAPREVKGHNDHMHVRIACPADDVAQGRCRDASASKPKKGKRWHRKMVCPRPVEPLVLPQI